MRVLVTRPEPAASATAARLAGLGHEAVAVPLLRIRALDWAWPEPAPAALAVTSANAFAALGPLPEIPLFAVGATTAAAARAHGVPDVRVGPGDAARLWLMVAEAGFDRVLHLAGEARAGAAIPAELRVEVREVYAAELADALPAAVTAALRNGAVDRALLYSARTAACFARLCDAAALPRRGIVIAALSPAVLTAAGDGWAAGFAAAVPDEAALFAAAGLAEPGLSGAS